MKLLFVYSTILSETLPSIFVAILQHGLPGGHWSPNLRSQACLGERPGRGRENGSGLSAGRWAEAAALPLFANGSSVCSPRTSSGNQEARGPGCHGNSYCLKQDFASAW